MAQGSTRRVIGPFLLALVFLGVLGGGVGFSLGTLSKHQRATTTADDNGGRDNGNGGGTGTGGGTGAGTGGGQNAHRRCLAHTENQANAGPLTQLLYLHTTGSEVWICQAHDGALYYQGHVLGDGSDLVEGTNALFLSDVAREGGNGFVATNTDPTGPVTKYHVTPDRLVKEFLNYQNPKPNQTEYASG